MRSPAAVIALSASFEDHALRWMRQHQFAQVAPVRFGPRALAGVTGAVAQKEGFELGAAASQILDRIGPSATKITHGFVAGLRNVDRGQISRAMRASQFDRIASIRFNAVAAAVGDERGSDDAAVIDCAWTSSPTKSRSLFMVCLLFDGFFIGDIVSTVIPYLRIGTAHPAQPASTPLLQAHHFAFASALRLQQGQP
jgi:hypothetical protein